MASSNYYSQRSGQTSMTGSQNSRQQRFLEDQATKHANQTESTSSRRQGSTDNYAGNYTTQIQVHSGGSSYRTGEKGETLGHTDTSTGISRTEQMFGSHATSQHDRPSAEEDKRNIIQIVKQLDRAIESHFQKCDKGKAWSAEHNQSQLRPGESQTNIEYLKVELQDWKARCRTLEEQDIKNLKEENDELKRQNSVLSTRLSTEMNAKVSSDETAIENINIKNRPMTIAEEYSNFCAHQWMEAKQALDDVLSQMNNYKEKYCEEERHRYLLEILLYAENLAKKKQQSTVQDVWKIFQKGKGKSDATMPIHLGNAIGDYLRSSCEDEDLSSLHKDVEYHLSKISSDIKYKTNSDHSCKAKISEYIKTSVQLAWKMVTQRPEMRFDSSGTGQNWIEAKHEIAWGSDDPKQRRTLVERYITPALYHGEQLMVKGKVTLRHTETNQPSTSITSYFYRK